MCIVCVMAPGVMTGGSAVGLIVHRLRLVLDREPRHDDSAAWAAAATGKTLVPDGSPKQR